MQFGNWLFIIYYYHAYKNRIFFYKPPSSLQILGKPDFYGLVRLAPLETHPEPVPVPVHPEKGQLWRQIDPLWQHQDLHLSCRGHLHYHHGRFHWFLLETANCRTTSYIVFRYNEILKWVWCLQIIDSFTSLITGNY